MTGLIYFSGAVQYYNWIEDKTLWGERCEKFVIKKKEDMQNLHYSLSLAKFTLKIFITSFTPLVVNFSSPLVYI